MEEKTYYIGIYGLEFAKRDNIVFDGLRIYIAKNKDFTNNLLDLNIYLANADLLMKLLEEFEEKGIIEYKGYDEVTGILIYSIDKKDISKFIEKLVDLLGSRIADLLYKYEKERTMKRLLSLKDEYGL